MYHTRVQTNTSRILKVWSWLPCQLHKTTEIDSKRSESHAMFFHTSWYQHILIGQDSIVFRCCWSFDSMSDKVTTQSGPVVSRKYFITTPVITIDCMAIIDRIFSSKRVHENYSIRLGGKGLKQNSITANADSSVVGVVNNKLIPCFSEGLCRISGKILFQKGL